MDITYSPEVFKQIISTETRSIYSNGMVDWYVFYSKEHSITLVVH